ncbi:MAG: SDR family NAD(P)-dependent oxidoreductase, partial [Candidatus Heimdallarchaeota archaeon]
INDINLNSAKEYNEKLSAGTVAEEIKNLGCRALSIQADITKRDQVEKMIQKIIKKFGKLDILVNNAGGNLNRLGHNAGFPKTYPSSFEEKDHQYIMDLNLNGTIYCCQAASKVMKKQRYGKIVNIASQSGLHVSLAMLKATSYCLSKAAVIHYTKLLAAELGTFNINVNCVAPSRLLTSRANAQRREFIKKTKKDLAEKKDSSIAEVAKTIAFLCSDISNSVNGQCISVFVSSSKIGSQHLF